MTAKILTFPTDEAAKLQLEGYVLIAWHPLDGWCYCYYGLYRGISARRYITGLFTAAGVNYGDTENLPRAEALKLWRMRSGDDRFAWHYMMSKAEAFPEKRQAHSRTPRALAHA